jgi:tricorn protease
LTQSPHLFLLLVEGGLPEPLPIPRATHGSFSPDGQSIAYGPNPEIVLWASFHGYRGGALGYIANYDLKNNRYSELPRTAANDVFPMWHGNNIYFASDRSGIMNLYRYDLGSRQVEELTHYVEWDIKNPSLGRDAIIFENGGWLYVMDLHSKQVHPVSVSVPPEALPRREESAKWQQLLDDAWRTYAEHAFRPATIWNSVKPKYDELIRWAAHQSDAAYVVREMLGEAGQSHINFWFAGQGNSGPSVGLLGADFHVEDGFYRIAKIYEGGPLAAPNIGAKLGDYLLSVDDVPVRSTREVYAALEGLAGRETKLVLSDTPSGTPREVKVTPVADERSLRIADWIQTNRIRVKEASGGRIGYIYISNVEPEGLVAFREQWSELRNQVAAVIVDVRNCNGGITSEAVHEWLAAKPTRRGYDRRGLVPPFGVFLDGPKVMIANDQSVSGCDEVPMFFKRARVGPIVGTRTFGGMFGAGATYELAAGGRMTVPEFGFYASDVGEWSPENYGVEPDYTTELTPYSKDGSDTQLEKAIDVATEALKTYKKSEDPPPYKPAR